MFNGEIMFHSAFKKDTEKVVFSERLDTNYCQIQGWKSFAYISITENTFEGHEISVTKTIVLICEHNLVHDFWTKSHKVHVSSP